MKERVLRRVRVFAGDAQQCSAYQPCAGTPPAAKRPSLSWAYIFSVMPHCLSLVWQIVALACFRTRDRVGIRIARSRAIIAITTSNSMSVKALELMKADCRSMIGLEPRDPPVGSLACLESLRRNAGLRLVPILCLPLRSSQNPGNPPVHTYSVSERPILDAQISAVCRGWL